VNSLETAGEGARPRTPVAIRRWLFYGLMVLATVAAFLLIRRYGETLAAPADSGGGLSARIIGSRNEALLHLLFALAAVIAVGQVLARLFAYLSQPPVIGEMIAGILLGPSLIGEKASALILPGSVAPYLSVVAQLGVILYMFTVGLELDAGFLRSRAQTTVATSHASIVAPFLLGSLLALFLYPRLSNSSVPFTPFALFLGLAMSITAFPVLARILTDRNMARTDLGIIALTCAAVDDVTAWCLLALVVGVTRAEVGGALLVPVWSLLFILVMFLVVRPVVKRLASRWEGERLPRETVALVLVALLVSTMATELIGIHAIFGAFLLGAVIPHDSAIARSFIRQLEHIVAVLFLPAFFAFTGMRTRIDLVSGWNQWLICAIIIAVATVGKFGGSAIAARLTGMDWRMSAALGTLMNTRGLMELVVLNIGLDLKVISPTLFSMMVLMALVTTIATSPVLRLLKPPTDAIGARADGS
jgi:K+:H+ antiporter